MAKGVKTIYRYSISFKQMVIKEVESGEEMSFIRKKYGIRGSSTIQKWLIRYGKTHLINKVIRIETMNERDRIKELEKQLKEAKIALADSMLAQKCLETLIEEANKEYKTDLKKNFGTASSKR